MNDAYTSPEIAPEPVETENSPLIRAVRDFIGRVFSDEEAKKEERSEIPKFATLDEKNLPLLHQLTFRILGIDLKDEDLIAIHDGLKMIGGEEDIVSFLRSDPKIIEKIHEAREAGDRISNFDMERSRILSAYIGRFIERQKNPKIKYRSDISVRLRKDAGKKGDEIEFSIDEAEHNVVPLVAKPHPQLKLVTDEDDQPESDHRVA